MGQYEASRSLENQSYQHWISQEVFSFEWFVMVSVLIVTYTVWLKLLDKSRVKDLVLFGSLLSVGYVLADVILGSYLGFYSYKISLVPFKPSVFILSITVAPIIFMLVLQYTFSWRSFMLWGAIGTALISFGLVPLYMHMEILQFYKGWNCFFSFTRTFVGGIIARAMLLWLISIENSHSMSSVVYQEYLELQPAASKLLSNDKDDKEVNDPKYD